MPHPYRAVIFDFDGVVAEQGFRAALVAATGRSEQEMPELRRQGMIALLKSGYVTGSGSEAAFAAIFEQRTGLALDRGRLREALLVHSVVRPWVLELSAVLRASGLITAVLTDHTDWLDDIERRAPFRDAFDALFNSYRIGASKAQPEVFERVTRALGVPPHAAIFIDDNPDNVARARSRGLAGILYQERDQMCAALAALLGETPPPSETPS